MKQKNKIFVGISGGVDSSVAAYLLKKAGYEVHGVFVKTWSPDWLPCTWVEEKRDAMRVCASLNIPFHFLDAEKEYKEGVADYMISEYRDGRTPNPDVLCNRIIKFGILWDYAKSKGADKIATGHYAQILEKNGNLIFQKGIDQAKDQSYFLWMIKKEELDHIVFPIGHLEKSEVRKIAQKAKLFTATKKDSQGICFLGDIDMKEFLSHYIENKKGDILNTKGEVIGSHEGVWFYTLGERHGFRINIKNDISKPLYIIGKDIEKNTLTVAENPVNQTSSSEQTKIVVRQPNWLEAEISDKAYQAKIRYRGEDINCFVISETEIILNSKKVVALGQSVVIYDKEQLIGGGIIDKLG